jgi:hypothetical protein
LNANVVATNLRRLAHHLRSLLERDSYSRLNDAAAYVESSAPRQTGRRRRPSPWQILIDSPNSLLFRPSEVDDRLAPDIFCDIVGPANDEWPLSRQNLVIRVWSLTRDLSFRRDWDSERIGDLLAQRPSYQRVLLRCHFDRANPEQEAPIFHLQIGGRATEQERELCWFPEIVNIPRLLCPPMDLVLAAEVVVASFFPTAFANLTNEPDWLTLVHESETFLLKEFYDKCHRVCNRARGNQMSVFTSLWQLPRARTA